MYERMYKGKVCCVKQWQPDQMHVRSMLVKSLVACSMKLAAATPMSEVLGPCKARDTLAAYLF